MGIGLKEDRASESVSALHVVRIKSTTHVELSLGHKLQVLSNKIHITCYRTKVTNYRLQDTYYNLQITGYIYFVT